LVENQGMAWNDERVDLLKKLWSDGLSASQIAGRLGGVTRNAVIGKVHRLGLSGRATTSRMKSHRPRVRTQTATKRLMKPRFANVGNPALRNLYLGDTEPYVPPAEEVEIPLKERKYIQTLTESCCRWPIGDPQQPDFHFCGKHKVPGLPYCEGHARRAFQPPQARRRDRDYAPMVIAGPQGAPNTETDQDVPAAPSEKAPV
jgi:GcrA cell cycle regulator